MENILCNKYISNKKSINREINKESQINKIGNEKSEEEEDEDEIDTKIFNGLLAEDKKLNTNNTNNSNNNNDKVTTQENKNSKNFDTYINENSNLFDLNFISFGDVNSLYNFQNGKIDTINKKNDSKNKNIINQNNKISSINNKLTLNNPLNKLKNGSEENPNSPSTQKIKRKNGSLLNNISSNEKNNEDNAIFLNKQILKINNLFDGLNLKKNKENNKDKMEIVRNYWESSTFFKISEINKGNAILVSVDDNIINFPAFLLPKGVKIGEIYNFQIKSMEKGFIYKNQKANEIDDIQKKYLNPD